MNSKYSYWRYIYKLKYFRDSRHEIYWIKAVLNFIDEVLESDNPRLQENLIGEIRRQLQFQSNYSLDTSYFIKRDADIADFRKKVVYQILYLSKSQRIDLMRNIVSYLPFGSDELEMTRQYVEAYTLAKNYSRKQINKYYVIINRAINEGRYTLAVQLSARCLREQYSVINNMSYRGYGLMTTDYLHRLRNFFDRRGSTWINRYYRRISKSSRQVFQYEDSVLNKYAIADERMAKYAMLNLRQINELIYKMKYCK